MSTSDLDLDRIERGLRTDYMAAVIPPRPKDRDRILSLVAEVRRLRDERDDLREWFECADCEHNICHPDSKCSLDPNNVDEFCTFLICGRCSNRRMADLLAERDEHRERGNRNFATAMKWRAERDEAVERADRLDRYLTRCDEARKRAITERDRLRDGTPVFGTIPWWLR